MGSEGRVGEGRGGEGKGEQVGRSGEKGEGGINIGCYCIYYMITYATL